MEFLMRWTSLVSKTVVAGAAGAFLVFSAAGVAPPRPASDADAGRETPADERPTAPGPGGTGAAPGATGGGPGPSPTAGHLSP
ncbi:hypothetical protein ACFU8I_04305 [Streptomyces sp. NPDC057540]|uniref:hypothetical protein n=1 Tax=Streptomyces sp. NPDC057540 TaxID=3346160 RepID=UPI0036C67BC6